MATITVEQLAKVVGITVAALLGRLKAAGVVIDDPEGFITDEQKQILLRSLKGESNGNLGSTLSLRRKPNRIERNSRLNVTVLKRRTHYEAASDNDSLLELDNALVSSKDEKSEDNSVSNQNRVPVGAEDGKIGKESKKDKSDSSSSKTVQSSIKEDKQIDKNKHSKITSFEARRREGDVRKHDYTITDSEGSTFHHKSKNRKAKKIFDQNTETASETKINCNKEITIPEMLTVAELAQQMSVKVAEVIKILFNLGVMATINQIIDQETAALVAEELGFKIRLVSETISENEFILLEEMSDLEMKVRAPVVTIMGHVDHGKTSLLDFIRRTKVAIKEEGGITQHIGAYRVQTKKGEITFIDTPGHEAFTAMRARGTKCTDIVILVVAADDGVMPQTVEAIRHAQAAKVPIIVAINKIDKPNVDLERIKTELTKYGIISEDWGGDVMFQEISAKFGTGVDELLDSVLVLAEVLELKAPVATVARGVVLESHLDKGHGPVATVLVQRGTLHQGDILLAGLYFGKVRAMFNDAGEKVQRALPSHPVEVLGLSGIPSAGDDILVVANEKKAREVALFRQSKFREVKLAKQTIKLENILSKMKEQDVKVLNVVLKTDLQGSLEAVTEMLGKLLVDEVRVEVIASGVGGITETDVNLALASHGIIIGFNVRADNTARLLAEREGVDIRYYSVIYKIMEDIKTALSGMLAPAYEEQMLGLAEVREVYKSSKFGTIAGCMILDGIIKRGVNVRVLRDQKVIFTGEIESLRRFKEDVNEVKAGIECGIGIKSYSDLQIKDQIESYKNVLVKRIIS